MEKMKILCYNIDEKTISSLKALTSRLKISVVSVEREDFTKPIVSVASGIFSEKIHLSMHHLPREWRCS